MPDYERRRGPINRRPSATAALANARSTVTREQREPMVRRGALPGAPEDSGAASA